MKDKKKSPRQRVLRFRVNEEEYKSLHQKFEQSNFENIADFFRACILTLHIGYLPKKGVLSSKEIDLLFDYKSALLATTNNINQLTKRFNILIKTKHQENDVNVLIEELEHSKLKLIQIIETINKNIVLDKK